MSEREHHGDCGCEKSKCESHDCGDSCMHGFSCHRRFLFVRWILGFIILAIVFSTGICIGQLTSFANDGSYYRGMMGRKYERGFQMMVLPRGYDYETVQGQ